MGGYANERYKEYHLCRSNNNDLFSSKASRNILIKKHNISNNFFYLNMFAII
ncbi:hypothetical protein DJ66_1055 [Candidatus Liberibacter solanacearum]|uniref:Uncharacterized protein n=1 Tax=Candidatus Liberibacter solanacearum TaxID=556287 RepID=A0A0F4VM22_9HYPH|nr:hypothetical protein DJ66_1055 [Candidatus Liberibacter solanacearum]